MCTYRRNNLKSNVVKCCIVFNCNFFLCQDKEVQTTPPTKNHFCTYATQWIIYDAYNDDYLKQQEEKEKEKRDKIALHGNKKSICKKKKTNVNEDLTDRNMLMAAKFLERIINLNAMDAIAQGTYMNFILDLKMC